MPDRRRIPPQEADPARRAFARAAPGGRRAAAPQSGTLAGLQAAADRAPGVVAQRRLQETSAETAPVQRWKSESLKEETDLDRINSLRGQAIFEAEQMGEYHGEVEAPYEVDPHEHLSARDSEQLGNLEHMAQVKEKGLAEDLHHILPRKMLNTFYDSLTPHEKEFLGGIFRRKSGTGGHRGPSDGGDREALTSLRSNLVLGPSGKKRSDDPDHRKGVQVTALDPNFTAPGEMEPVSATLAGAFPLIAGLAAITDPLARLTQINIILEHFLDAELEHARKQGKEGFWDTTIDYHTEDQWERDETGTKWKKKFSED